MLIDLPQDIKIYVNSIEQYCIKEKWYGNCLILSILIYEKLKSHISCRLREGYKHIIEGSYALKHIWVEFIDDCCASQIDTSYAILNGVLGDESPFWNRTDDDDTSSTHTFNSTILFSNFYRVDADDAIEIN